jgi:predicted SnoaL-like aldol condensation-catalyzing enzyme
VSRTAEEQANLDLVLKMYEEVICAMDSSKVDTYLSPDYVQHSSLAEPGLPALKAFLDGVRVRAPEIKLTIHRAIVDGDQVALHVHAVRRPGDRGRAVIDWYRVKDGMVVEHWDVLQDVPDNPVTPLSMF